MKKEKTVDEKFLDTIYEVLDNLFAYYDSEEYEITWNNIRCEDPISNKDNIGYNKNGVKVIIKVIRDGWFSKNLYKSNLKKQEIINSVIKLFTDYDGNTFRLRDRKTKEHVDGALSEIYYKSYKKNFKAKKKVKETVNLYDARAYDGTTEVDDGW